MKKEAMNLEKNREGFMGGLRGRKGREVIKLQSQKSKKYFWNKEYGKHWGKDTQCVSPTYLSTQYLPTTPILSYQFIQGLGVQFKKAFRDRDVAHLAEYLRRPKPWS